jgi:hypothetical protein
MYLWNIILPWNRVLTSSMSIFQTSREHVLVALTVAHFAPAMYLALIVAIVLLLLQRTSIKKYHYRHRHYIVIHQPPLCVVLRRNISLSLYAFFRVTNPRYVLLCNVAQPVTRVTVSAVVCPTWRDITQAVGFFINRS